MQMQNRGTLFGGGIVMVVLGIIFLAFPGFTMSFFTVLAGIGFLAGGISAIVAWWGTREFGGGGGVLFFGILSIIFALVCLVHPLALATTLTWLVALCVLIAGIAQIASLIAMGDFPMRAAAIASTAIMALFGLFALIWPPMVVQFVGISLVIEGVTAFVLGLTSKQSF